MDDRPRARRDPGARSSRPASRENGRGAGSSPNGGSDRPPRGFASLRGWRQAARSGGDVQRDGNPAMRSPQAGRGSMGSPPRLEGGHGGLLSGWGGAAPDGMPGGAVGGGGPRVSGAPAGGGAGGSRRARMAIPMGLDRHTLSLRIGAIRGPAVQVRARARPNPPGRDGKTATPIKVMRGPTPRRGLGVERPKQPIRCVAHGPELMDG